MSAQHTPVPWFVLDEREPGEEAEDKACEVCVDGRYLFIDQHGKDRGTIRCPVCFGSGVDPGDEDEEDEDDPAEVERHRERLIAAWQVIQSNATGAPE